MVCNLIIRGLQEPCNKPGSPRTGTGLEQTQSAVREQTQGGFNHRTGGSNQSIGTGLTEMNE